VLTARKRAFVALRRARFTETPRLRGQEMQPGRFHVLEVRNGSDFTPRLVLDHARNPHSATRRRATKTRAQLLLMRRSRTGARRSWRISARYLFGERVIPARQSRPRPDQLPGVTRRKAALAGPLADLATAMRRFGGRSALIRPPANCRILIDKCPVSCYIASVSLRVKDAGRLTAAGGSEDAVPAGFGSSPWLSGGLGIILPALRPAREVLAGLRQVRRG
jgi:hypothetical protein